MYKNISINCFIKNELDQFKTSDGRKDFLKRNTSSFLLSLVIVIILLIFSSFDSSIFTKSIIEKAFDISLVLLSISVAYIIFVITLIFTFLPKTILLTISSKNSQNYLNIFSPYITLVLLTATNFIISLILMFAALTEGNLITNYAMSKIGEFNLLLTFSFLNIFCIIFSVLFFVRTIVLFIENLTFYMELKHKLEEKEQQKN